MGHMDVEPFEKEGGGSCYVCEGWDIGDSLLGAGWL